MKIKINNKLILERIIYQDKDKTKLETLILRKEIKKKLPGLVLIHGHKGNAWKMLFKAYFLAKLNFVVLIPTQRGYFPSGGKPDFCGQKTLSGILKAINIFLRKKYLKKEKLIIWGISRGANIVLSIATKKPAIFKLAVLQSGFYDLKNHYTTTKILGIKKIILKEIKIFNKKI